MGTVIVFGPTGSVGSVVARTAEEQGAKVVLAMRDPQKTIPGLGSNISENYARIQADLTDAESVAAAVRQSGARRAFFYLAHSTPDHMLSAIKAMKSSGVDFAVFLSSYTIKAELQDVPPSEIIPFAHAKVELSLNEIFGEDNYVALRPGGFATNVLRFKQGIKSGKVSIHGAGFQTDCITPGDMGRVGGTILVHGPKNGQKKVYLYGPQIISQGTAIKRVGKILGRTVQLENMDGDQALKSYLGAGIPKPVAEYIIQKATDTTDGVSDRPHYNEGVVNVQLYTGKPAETLESWAQSAQELFLA